MDNIIEIYEKNILSINNSLSIYQYLQKQAKNLDATILLRAQLVLIVSAFDTYVHSLVIYRVLEEFFSAKNEIVVKLDIPIELMYEIKKSESDVQRSKLHAFLVKELSKDSFQSPKSIEYALSIIGISKIWTQLSEKMSMNADEIKRTLSLIVNRRNKIAHESDWNKLTNTYENIEIDDVILCRDFINKLVYAINSIVFE